jgi:hypothetical protein
MACGTTAMIRSITSSRLAVRMIVAVPLLVLSQLFLDGGRILICYLCFLAINEIVISFASLRRSSGQKPPARLYPMDIIVPVTLFFVSVFSGEYVFDAIMRLAS